MRKPRIRCRGSRYLNILAKWDWQSKRAGEMFDKVFPLAVRLTDISDAAEAPHPDTVKSLWFNYMRIGMRYWGWNPAAQEHMLSWGRHGHNWKALWPDNSEYKDQSAADLLRTLAGEATYISDRMSIDRLLRTHWIYNYWTEKRNEEIAQAKEAANG